MRLYDEVKGAGTRIFPDGKVKYGEDVYVYSSSWRMTVPPFCFYPWTTVVPINRDFSKAISFRWNRDQRNMLGLFLHSEVAKTVRQWGLEPLYKLALLCFARGGGQPAVMNLAQWHARHDRAFPLSELVGSARLRFGKLFFALEKLFLRPLFGGCEALLYQCVQLRRFLEHLSHEGQILLTNPRK
jgi:hypothetical protein